MVLVFRTSVKTSFEVKRLSPVLENLTACEGIWNFDLEDCDCILRIESRHLQAKQVELALLKCGYHCTELED